MILRSQLISFGKRIFPLGSVIVFLFFCSPAAYESLKSSSDLKILLITMDTTRADRVGCYGYSEAKTPNIDALASKGVRFANTYAQVPLTLPSHCSILTGTYPIYHSVHNNGFYYLDQSSITIAQILKEKDFKTAAFVSSFTVDSRFGIDQGFDFYDDKFDEEEILKNFRSERRAGDVYGSFSRWLDENHAQKFFCWIHFFDPHLPYEPPSPFREEFSGRPYDGEIAYMDFYIGKTVNELREKNILGKTLIILAGDHGEALGEKREIDHGLFIYDGTLKVPLIFYAKNYLPDGLIIDARVRLIDIMPTILDILNIPVNKENQGVSLLPLMESRAKDDLPSYIETYFPKENYGWSPLIGLIDNRWKYIQAPQPELYNLKQDPGEEKNIIHQRKKIARDMDEKLKKTIKKFSSQRTAIRKKLTSEEEQRLKSLGYITGTSSKDSYKKSLPDPKNRIEEYILYFRGNLHETRGEYKKAAECYKEILRLNPEVPNNYLNLSFLYMKMNRFDEAIQILKQGRKRNPDSLVILSRLMSFYIREERFDEALVVSRAVLGINPQYFDALFLSGSVYAKMGRWKKALSFYERALEIEPENKTLQMKYGLTLAALGEYDKVLKVYKRLQTEYPDDHKIYLEVSRVYESIDNRESAKESLRRAIELHPTSELYYEYAFLLERLGDLKEAVFWLKKYLETTPETDMQKKNNARIKLNQWEKRLEFPK